MGKRSLIVLLALVSSGCVSNAATPAQESKPCNEYSELECTRSSQCTLVQTGQHGGYACRAAQGRCETGFRQVSDGDIQKDCEAKPGCEFKPASCYCPPNLECVCGGGPPAQCRERTKSK